jgi:hypothetical protein
MVSRPNPAIPTFKVAGERSKEEAHRTRATKGAAVIAIRNCLILNRSHDKGNRQLQESEMKKNRHQLIKLTARVRHPSPKELGG